MSGARLLIVTSLLIGQLNVLAQSPALSDRFTGEQIQRDLDSLAQWILAVHPSPFVHSSSIEFEEALSTAKSTFAGGATLFGAAQMAAKVCNVIKDSHTGVALQGFSRQLGGMYGHVPMEIQTVNNRLIVTAIAGDGDALGKEVVSLNGTPSRSVLGSALALVSQEGDAALARLRMAEKLWNDIAPFAIGASPGDSVRVEFSDGSNRILPVMGNDEISAWHNDSKPSEPLRWEVVRASDNTVAMALTIGHFHPENARSFRKALKACFAKITDLEASPDTTFTGLVIDLRGNSGGNIAVMAELLPYLIEEPTILPAGVQVKGSEWARDRWGSGRFGWVGNQNYLKNLKELNAALGRIANDSIAFVPFDRPIRPARSHAYSGPASLLLSGLSASATVSIASWFVRSGRGETFGEPPMGSISGTFGNPVRVELPETGLSINIASARYFTQKPVRWEASPLLVDHPVIRNAADHASGADPVLQAALQWHAQLSYP